MRKALSVGFVALVVLAGCETKPVLDPRSGGGVGRVNGNDQISSLWDTSDTAIVSSAEVDSGYQFTVSFKTIAHECDWPDYVAVQGGGSSVTVTPYDLNSSGPGLNCPMIVTSAERSTQVVLTTIGLDTVNVQGRSGDGIMTIHKIIKVVPPPGPGF